MRGLQDGMLPPCAPFCAVGAPNVTALALKAAEDGNRYVPRLQEAQARATAVIVIMPYVSLPHAYETNLVEEDVRLLPCTAHSVTVHTKPFSLYMVRLGQERDARLFNRLVCATFPKA
jgi:alpha-mannosidase